jgi:archaellum component FlaC
MSTCNECTKSTKTTDKIVCNRCNLSFHFLCVNLTATEYKRSKSNWACPNCTHQPRNNGSPNGEHATTSNQRNRSTENMDISCMVREELREVLRTELPIILRNLLETELTPIKEQLNSLQNSVTFMSNQYDDIHHTISTLTNDVKDLTSEREELRSTITNLSTRLNQIEQNMRDCNVEIQGIPEGRNEDLAYTVKHIAEVVSCGMSDADVLHCTRIASQNKDNNKARAIIAKLRSTRCRDELLSAVARFNKTKSRDQKLNSSLLGLGGAAVPVYVSEHLSPANKTLYWAARKKAIELSYKYVWVRNGSIFLRKDDQSRYTVVRTQLTLDSLH